MAFHYRNSRESSKDSDPLSVPNANGRTPDLSESITRTILMALFILLFVLMCYVLVSDMRYGTTADNERIFYSNKVVVEPQTKREEARETNSSPVAVSKGCTPIPIDSGKAKESK